MAATRNVASATQLYQQILGPCISFRRPKTVAKSLRTSFFSPKHVIRHRNVRNRTVKSCLVEQSQQKSMGADVERLVDFLYEDMHHVFDDQGIDLSGYDESFTYRDPITKHDTIGGHLFNIALLKMLFKPELQLHWVKQTGPYEITARWTVAMTSILLPWKPDLVITGTSLLGINPDTHKFCSHVDSWDSIKSNEYFSIEGLLDVIKQLNSFKTPGLELPKYYILKRTASYEIREYAPFIAVESNENKLSDSTGLNDHVVGLPAPGQDSIRLRNVEGGIVAVSKFSGEPTEDIICEKEVALRSSLARYNDPSLTWRFTTRNEVMIWLKEFKLD